MVLYRLHVRTHTKAWRKDCIYAHVIQTCIYVYTHVKRKEKRGNKLPGGTRQWCFTCTYTLCMFVHIYHAHHTLAHIWACCREERSNGAVICNLYTHVHIYHKQKHTRTYKHLPGGTRQLWFTCTCALYKYVHMYHTHTHTHAHTHTHIYIYMDA